VRFLDRLGVFAAFDLNPAERVLNAGVRPLLFDGDGRKGLGRERLGLVELLAAFGQLHRDVL